MVGDQPLRIFVLKFKMPRHSKWRQDWTISNLLLLHFIAVDLSCNVRNPINELATRNNITGPYPLLQSLHLLHWELEKPVRILVDSFFINVCDPLLRTPKIDNFVSDVFTLLNNHFSDSIKLIKIDLLIVVQGRIRFDFIFNFLRQKQVLFCLFLHFNSSFIFLWV